MSIQTILTVPNPILRQTCVPVTAFDERLDRLLRDLRDTLADYGPTGVGLSAPQIGILEKVMMMLYRGREIVLINPEILTAEGAQTKTEGCLSCPGATVSVTRAQKIHVQAYTRKGKLIRLVEHGMMARIIQHEMDHLNGILILDKPH